MPHLGLSTPKLHILNTLTTVTLRLNDCPSQQVASPINGEVIFFKYSMKIRIPSMSLISACIYETM